jgi:hypothetical protein
VLELVAEVEELEELAEDELVEDEVEMHRRPMHWEPSGH